MTRRGVNAGPQLDGSKSFHAEALSEIWPLLMIGDELQPFKGLGQLLPFGDLGIKLGEIGVTVARELRLILGSKRREGGVNVLDDGFCQDRVQVNVGITVGMNVARVMIGRLGHITGCDVSRAVHVAWLSYLDAGILAGFD